MRKYRFLLIISVLCFECNYAVSQTNNPDLNEVKDSIVARYNRNDFKGIYQLADTAFSNHITENQLSGFLRGNLNSGNILSARFQTVADGKSSYLLKCETRDIKMTLAVADKKFTTFGFSNVPIELLKEAPNVKNNNPLKTPTDKLVDSLARSYFKNSNSSGLSIGIVAQGAVQTYHYGSSNKNTEQLPSSHTLYEIGSVTKTFTATLLAQAVIDGKVTLNDDIRKYLSGDYPNLSFQGAPITLLHLANHTSRLPGLPDDLEKQPNFNPVIPEAHYDSAMYFAALHRVKLDTVPGYKYNYSNWGISLLGHIMEGVYAKPYEDLLKEYVTKPFGMKDTYYDLTQAQKKRMAYPYTDNGRQGPSHALGIFGPAGGLHSTLGDMLKYLHHQISETNPAVKLTHQQTAGNVGLGWGVRKKGDKLDFQHNGSTIGFVSHISVFPQARSGLVILANSKADVGPLIYGLQKVINN
ncbi:beta-lactamase family protein [Dyadobacter chenwenxiniae]|uniref:Beta-lactamase family protein n=1 Tax=Dyadobacter chenwenxiniae TaxID=2906456 RepID=A0A9X1TNI5_9BACT|nr:serine hydrolase domain-containing protein [Dyadobacter chenwenxiniae]MCF0064588.1 beta-lactamase family protein [Dyadobacter chenwenxiniae]UON84354.1 beta-lactamase family protein [Dyadobacter chenwenxiniae]